MNYTNHHHGVPGFDVHPVIYSQAFESNFMRRIKHVNHLQKPSRLSWASYDELVILDRLGIRVVRVTNDILGLLGNNAVSRVVVAIDIIPREDH